MCFFEWQYTRKVHCATPLCRRHTSLTHATATCCCVSSLLFCRRRRRYNFVCESKGDSMRTKVESQVPRFPPPILATADCLFPTNEWHISTEFLVLSPILSRSLSASPLKGESVPLNIWEVGFIFELVYIIRTWKFVEIKCMRDWLCALCVCEWDERLKLFKPLKLSQCCPLKLVYACIPCIPPFWMVDWGRAAGLVLKIAITCPLPFHSSPFPFPL